MPSTPSGTVTFIFTDIVNSTVLWERSSDAMAAALERHNGLLRAAFEAHGGYVFSTGGDGFCVAFGRAADAVQAAVEGQRALLGEAWPAAAQLSVRMGLHSGEALERDGDYFGPAVNRAARIMSLAQGGQILASLACKELLRDTSTGQVTLNDLGEMPLRGLVGLQRMFELCAPGLPPGLSSPVHQQRGNLPVAATSFVGRTDDVKRLRSAIAAHRMVTLVGVGGVGKTRLAMEAAWQAEDEFPDGVWLCELAPVTDPDGVAPVVLSTLGLRVEEGLTVIASVVEGLRRRRALLILDNCEHVIDAAAALAAAVNVGCGSVAVLATSREPLAVDGERVWPVRSLDPALEGVALFLDRAAAADADFDPSGHLDVIQAICTRLDGIPLAIELAASRVRTMTVVDISEHLHDRFRLLRGAGRGRVERHQTLRAAVQWSYELLSPAERTVFDCLSVFPGSFDLGAASVICTDRVNLDAPDVADIVGPLADCSMVTADRSGEHVRYRLLETFRQFGNENLPAEDIVGLRDRHLQHYLEVVEHAQVDLEERDFSRGRRSFAMEWDNIRAVAEWAVVSGRDGSTARLHRAVQSYMWMEASLEVGRWAIMAIESGARNPDVYSNAATMMAYQGDLEQEISLARTGLGLVLEPLAPETVGLWGHLFLNSSAKGDVLGTREAVENAYQASANADRFRRAYYGQYSAMWLRDHEAARQRLHESLAIARETGNMFAIGFALNATGNFERAQGNLLAGIESCTAALEVAREHNLPVLKAHCTRSLALMSSEHGLGEPVQAWIDALDTSAHWLGQLGNLGYLALWWGSIGRLEQSAMLIGNLEAHGKGLPPGESHRTVEAILAEHTEGARWKAAGAALDRDEIVEYAFRELRASLPGETGVDWLEPPIGS